MYYVLLDDLTTRRCTAEEFARYFHTMDRQLARETVAAGVEVSTVFLGIDHGFGGEVLLFETMVFGGELNGEQDRYATYDAAMIGHRQMVARVIAVEGV